MSRMAVLVFLLMAAASAEAYVGPGMGLGVIGAAFGLVAAIFLALVGMVWYPVKRLFRGKRDAAPQPGALGRADAERPGP
ncbi:MAG TPA: hypothetical protein VFO94_10540 [Gammaproteobacteria bacterium]|nr:hypothetical protein [Gammaproteobacteria bacterium]